MYLWEFAKSIDPHWTKMWTYWKDPDRYARWRRDGVERNLFNLYKYSEANWTEMWTCFNVVFSNVVFRNRIRHKNQKNVRFFERSLWTRAMDAEKIEKLGTKKIWAVDGELYLWQFAKCSDSYSPKSGTTIVEFERRWSTCISTVRYTRHKNWLF